MSTYSVLFVCLGNICRSPMAEALFSTYMKDKRLSIQTASAAIGPWHVGNPPDPRTIAEAARHNIDIRHYRGRQITPPDFRQFTHIIGMDRDNIAKLKKLAPADATGQIELLMNYVPDHHHEDVMDPYYHDQKMFAQTWEHVNLGIMHLVKYFEQKR